MQTQCKYSDHSAGLETQIYLCETTQAIITFYAFIAGSKLFFVILIISTYIILNILKGTKANKMCYNPKHALRD